MKMKCAVLVLLASVLVISSCTICEVVINPDGPAFLKIINDLDSSANLFLPEYAFGAEIDPGACEIYGMDVGEREAEITVGSDTVNLQFTLEDGETHVVELSQYF